MRSIPLWGMMWLLLLLLISHNMMWSDFREFKRDFQAAAEACRR
jgi:hypothetical protein